MALEMRHGSNANKVGITAQGAKRPAQRPAANNGAALNTVRLADAKTPTLAVDIPAALANSASKKSAGQSQSSSMKATIVSSQKLATQRNPPSSNKAMNAQKKAPVPMKPTTRDKTSKLRGAPQASSRQNFMSQPAAGSRKVNKLSSFSATGTDDAREPYSGAGDGSSYN